MTVRVVFDYRPIPLVRVHHDAPPDPGQGVRQGVNRYERLGAQALSARLGGKGKIVSGESVQAPHVELYEVRSTGEVYCRTCGVQMAWACAS